MNIPLQCTCLWDSSSSSEDEREDNLIMECLQLQCDVLKYQVEEERRRIGRKASVAKENQSPRRSQHIMMSSSSGNNLLASASMAERNLLDKDKLILRGLMFNGFHGVKPEEKKLGQKFLVDVDAWLDLSEAGKTDNMSDSVSYVDIYRIVKEVMEGPSHNLLESVSHLIANTTLQKFPQISAVRVKIGKPHVAIEGPVDYLGVEILRYQKA